MQRKKKIAIDAGDWLLAKDACEKQIKQGQFESLINNHTLKWINKKLEKLKLPSLSGSVVLPASE
jgi:hypothetical protein